MYILLIQQQKNATNFGFQMMVDGSRFIHSYVLPIGRSNLGVHCATGQTCVVSIYRSLFCSRLQIGVSNVIVSSPMHTFDLDGPILNRFD